jgi:hypothetical protein
MIEKNKQNKLIRKAGFIGALVGGMSLASFAWLGIWEALAVSSLLLEVLSALLAFMVGAAIGGGLGVWISERSVDISTIPAKKR